MQAATFLASGRQAWEFPWPRGKPRFQRGGGISDGLQASRVSLTLGGSLTSAFDFAITEAETAGVTLGFSDTHRVGLGGWPAAWWGAGLPECGWELLLCDGGICRAKDYLMRLRRAVGIGLGTVPLA